MQSLRSSDSSHVPLTWDGAPVATWANVVTAVRTIASVVIGIVGVHERSMTLLVIAYAVYWVGDSLDGNVARWLDRETRLGAVFDILSDRACSAVLIGGLFVVRPEWSPALGVYFLQFMVVDCMLTLAFLHWPIVSPNYFYKVDRRIWQLNWSVPAKTANTTLLVVVLLIAPVAVATALAIVQLAVKLWSSHRMLRIAARDDACSTT